MTTSYPLTHSQQLMWLGQQLHPHSSLYNQSTVFIINSAIDRHAFHQAHDALVQSSDIMRTVIVSDGDTVHQTVLDEMPYQVEMVNFSGEPNARIALDDWLDQRVTQVFNLDKCLFDSVLIQLDDNQYAWYFGQHHIVTDGGSTSLLYEKLSAYYQQALEGEVTIVDMPRFADYIAYEQAHMDTDAYNDNLAYWDEHLKQETETLDLFGHNEPSTTRAIRNRVSLGSERMAKLVTLAEQVPFRAFSSSMTYANLFAALTLAFFHRLSGHNAMRLGMPMFNRPTKRFRKTAGLFIEVVSLFADFDENETLESLVEKVAAENIQALQHTSPAVSSAEHNRAYDVLLNFVPTQYDDFAGLPTEAIWLHPAHGDSNHQLRLQVQDMNKAGEFELLFDFNTAHFSELERQQTIERFLLFMDACIADPTQIIHEIDVLLPEELAHKADTNNTQYAVHETIIEAFDAQVAKTPDATAMSLGDEALSYRQVLERVNIVSAKLQADGVQHGDFVPVCMARHCDLVIAFLGIMKAGAVYVPLEPNDPNKRLLDILDDLGDVTGIITDTPERFDDYRTWSEFDNQASVDVDNQATEDNLAYVLYTSGTTGKPKGVKVAHKSLINYLSWAAKQYDGTLTFALYSSVAVDLTVTSIFTPLITGGKVRIYPDTGSRGTLIRDVFEENAVDVVKLTPSHLALVQDMDLAVSRVQQLIVGGEIFQTTLAQTIHRLSNGRITQYNEYGPTEATVACMLHQYDPVKDNRPAVPIGEPIAGAKIYILDRWLHPVPTGIRGEMYIGGAGVAAGYHNRQELTQERFIEHRIYGKLYKTGDVARWLPSGDLEFLGRGDRQVKIRGVRIELDEIEALLDAHPQVEMAVVMVRDSKAETKIEAQNELQYCSRCGLASSYPGTTFDADGVCNICRAYEGYKDRAQQYFKPMAQLEALAETMKAKATDDYDCIALMSGGKDSTYMVYRLANMGLRVLTFTLDNGYISDEAKANIMRVTTALGVDHHFAETPHMNAIFVDSLRTYANVCNGCFKTIYTLAGQLAQQKGIKYIVTGLSRGQFFETRLTEEVFAGEDFDITGIDEMIAKARRAYHQRDDIISRSLDVDVFREQSVVDAVEFVDFYRYCDVSLDEVYEFLNEHGLWVRPSDTGRSTNCLINEAGIWLHKKQRGFHNYALPYSWDVRVGHKTRDEAMEELDDQIDETNVKRMLREIGYNETLDIQATEQQLVVFYVGDATQDSLREHLAERLPATTLPNAIVPLDDIPLRSNGKVDYSALAQIDISRGMAASQYVAPHTDLEADIVDLWQEVLHLERVGVEDNFFNIGGHSLPAIRIVSRLKAMYEVDVPLDVFFSTPTVTGLANAIEDIIMQDFDALSDEEVLRLLEEDD